MAPKRDLSDKDAPGKKKARKSINLEQKMDISSRYNRRESTATIRNELNLHKSTSHSCSTKVSSSQSNIMVWIEKMLVTWMDHRKRQSLSMTFEDIKKKVMDCYNYLKEKETGPVPSFVTCTGWFSIMSSARERLRAPMLLFPTQIA